MSGFGRKGTTEGIPAPMGIDGLRNGAFRPSPQSIGQRAAPMDGDLARKREAFLAEERAQRAAGGASGGNSGIPDATEYRSNASKPERSLPMAYMIWFLLCNVSGHRFYLGAYRSAMAHVALMLVGIALIFADAVTLGAIMWGASMLWALGDVFFIHRLHRNLCRQKVAFGTAFA